MKNSSSRFAVVDLKVPTIFQAADEGAQNTAKMQAQAGRASYIGSAILSEPDPGAIGVVLWLKAIGTALK